MIDSVFYTLLNMSITASLIGFLVIILRKVKYIPRQGIYCLWALVLFRFILPFSVSSSISLMNFTGSLIKKVVSVKTLTTDGMKVSTMNSIGAADTYFPVTYKTQQLNRVFEISAFVWFVGAVVAIVVAAILYYLTSSELRRGVLVKNNIYSSNMVQAPIVHGIFKQRIIIPKELIDNAALEYVLLHEAVHVKRHDNLIRLIVIFTSCLHWFNPFIWIFMKLFLDDMELTCDINSVKSLPLEARKQYARTLLSVSSRQQIFMSTAFGNTNVKVRVMNVLTYKKLSIFALVVTMIFIIVVSSILLTNSV